MNPKHVVLDSKVKAALRDSAVTNASFGRRVLWSWTTPEQIAALRKDKQLLIPGELPSGPTPYVQLLEQAAAAEGPYGDVARLVSFHPSFKLRRYAWSRPWPTRMGLADRDYGTELVRIVLAPNAIIARFDPSRPDVFELHDLDDRVVTIGDFLANPSRLAAVLHVRTQDTPVAHREYVVCNEAMIAEWSIATPDIKTALADDRTLLAALASNPPNSVPVMTAWRGDGAEALYESALAFDNDRYKPTPDNLRAIENALKVEQSGAPFAHVPTTKFAFDAVVPNVVVRKRVRRIPTVV